jgi:hypothetical protein
MFGFSYPAAATPNISAMEQRLRKLEGQLDRAARSGGRQVSSNLSSGNLSEAGDKVGSVIRQPSAKRSTAFDPADVGQAKTPCALALLPSDLVTTH